MLLISCKLLYKRLHSAGTLRRWGKYSYKLGRRGHSQVDEKKYLWRLCTVSDGHERLRRERMCTATNITTRSLLV